MATVSTGMGNALVELQRDADALRLLLSPPTCATCQLLRTALVGLVGAESREELEAMEVAIRSMPAPAADKAASVDAIHALLATIEPRAAQGGD